MGKINHISHGFGPVRDGHAHSDIARNGAPKNVHPIEVAHGHRSRSGGADILSGGSAKRTAIAPPVPGQRSRTSQHSSDLGEAILRTAFSRSDSADCVAHGRNPDGSRKC
jgi:hypothetical protein